MTLRRQSGRVAETLTCRCRRPESARAL